MSNRVQLCSVQCVLCTGAVYSAYRAEVQCNVQCVLYTGALYSTIIYGAIARRSHENIKNTDKNFP